MTAPIYTTAPLTRRQQYELLRSEFKTERTSFIYHWNELADFILPRRGRFMLSDVNRGDRRTKNIIDSTGTFASRTLGSGMHSGMTSPSRPWFQYGVTDPLLNEIPAVKAWLYEATKIVHTVFAKTNLYKTLPTLYQDAGVFATSAMIHLEDDEDVAYFDTFPIGSYMIGTDDRGRVRQFMREYTLTVAQLIKRFSPIVDGLHDMRNISQQVQDLWRTGARQLRIQIIHVIVPNDFYDTSAGHLVSPSKKAFVECYYELGSDRTWYGGKQEVYLKEGGYDEFPVYAFRWEVAGEDTYGTNSPGMTALGDIKQLQHGEKRGSQALDLLVKPPMKGPTTMKSAKASIIAGDITYVDEQGDKGGYKPVFEIRPDLDKLEAKQEQKRYLIRRAFHEDLFLQMISDTRLQRPTAREVDERHEEKLLALGPVLEQVTRDVLDPLTTRQFNICLRKGMFPEPPEELRGQPLKVEYISIMATAMKMIGIGSLDRFTSSIVQIATVQPDVLDGINTDEVADAYHEMTGVPPKLLRDPKERDAIREARAKQAQQAQTATVAKDAGQAAASLASADSRSPNALTDLLAQSRAPGATQRAL